jgi:hypothetical protein
MSAPKSRKLSVRPCPWYDCAISVADAGTPPWTREAGESMLERARENCYLENETVRIPRAVSNIQRQTLFHVVPSLITYVEVNRNPVYVLSAG